MNGRIIVVDDESSVRRILAQLLEEAGFEVRVASSRAEALSESPAFRPDVALIDLKLAGHDGIETMETIIATLGVDAPVVIIMTAHGSIPSAVDAVHRGAADYLAKPFDNEQLLFTVDRALQRRRLERRIEALEGQLDHQFRPASMIGTSPAMCEVFRLVGRVALVDTTVLITGESGTGKELIARAIHWNSPRRLQPFIAINCGAIPATLVESTFFGHERGAFTDAKDARRGAFEQASGGTLFLDEVSELSLDAQTRLLRVLQEREVQRIGSERSIPIDVRIVAASNRDIEREVADRRFREDLYFRLNVVTIGLPPLRKRVEDIPALADHFAQKHAQRLGLPYRHVGNAAMGALLAFDWPGNVRELENVIERAVALAVGTAIDVADLPARLRPGGSSTLLPENGTLAETVSRATAVVEERLIRDALSASGGNRNQAAERLGITRRTLLTKMTELGFKDG